MTTTLTPETEARLRARAEREGQDIQVIAEALIRAALEWEAQDRAEAEIESAYLGRMRYGPAAADRWYAGLARAWLAQWPRRFPIVPESEALGFCPPPGSTIK